MNEVISTIVTSAATVISGLVLFFLKRFFHRQQEKEELRDRAKSDETALILRSLNALGKLTLANSIALRDGKTNGEMSCALNEYKAVEEELYRYLISNHTDLR